MTTTNRLISPEYLAGFFDGEGTFLLGQQQHKNGNIYPHASIILSQSGPDGLALLERIQAEYGGKIYLHLKAGQYKATKNAYKLYWNKLEGVSLCDDLIPHLFLKREKAIEVRQYLMRTSND